MTIDFGELRSLLHQPDKDNAWRQLLWALLSDAYEDDPEHYNDQWLPYLTSTPPTTWNTPLKCLNTLDDLTLAAIIAPFARFELRSTNHEPLQDILNHPGAHLLTGIDVWGSAIHPGDLLALQQTCPQLETLKLNGCQLNPPLIEELSQNEPWTHLKTLGLSDNGLTNDLVHTLVDAQNFPELVALTLSNNHLDDQALTTIANAKHLPKLQHLELDDNDIYGSGLVDLANAPLLAQLKYISISSNDYDMIDYRDYVYFLKATQALSHQIEMYIDAEEPDWAEAFYQRDVHRDHAVDFGGYHMDDDDFILLSQHPKLRETKKLHFTDMQLEASNLQILFDSENLAHIEELDITQATLPQNTPTALAGLKHLQSLHLYETNLDDAMWLDTLARADWPHLTALGLGYNHLTDESLKVISEKLHNLKDITFWNNQFTFDGLRHFLQHTQSHLIDHLLCDGMPLPSESTSFIARSHPLHINHFNMEDCELAEQQLQSLIENLEYISISKLDLGHNNIGPAGAKAIAQCQRFDQTNIILSHNPIENEGLLAIARSEHMRSITEMNLGGMDLTQDVFFELQGHVTPWTKLWCNLPTMDTDGFEAMLNVCPHIRDLTLNHGPNADQALALLTHHPLNTLCLFTTSLSDDGVQTLLNSPWLEQLKTLRFWHAPITNLSAQKIANCPRLSHLEHLSFYETGVDEQGIEQLRQSPYLSANIKSGLH